MFCLNAWRLWVWMGNNRHQLNPGSTDRLWVLGFSKSGDLPSLVHCLKQTPCTMSGSSWIHNSCSKSMWQSWLRDPLCNFVLCASCTCSLIRRLHSQLLMAWSPPGRVSESFSLYKLQWCGHVCFFSALAASQFPGSTQD